MKTLTVLCALLLALVCSPVRAGPDATLPTELHHEIWTSKEGAPIDIGAMAQTTDGWIWLATPNGLYRFDGVRFTRFQPRQGEALLEARLTNMYAAPNGDLWIGYGGGGGGVTLLRHGRLTHHAPAQPAIGSLYRAQQDHDGSLWFATGNALLHFVRGVWHKIGQEEGLPPGVVTNVFVDQYGRVWVLSSHRVFVRNRPGAPFVRPFPAEENGAFTTASDGTVWLETEDGMRMLDRPPGRAALPARTSGGAANSAPYLFDRAGNFWTRNDDFTLLFMRAAELAGKTAFRRDAAPRGTVSVEKQQRANPEYFMEDREGNVWLSSSEGLERYRPQRVHNMPMDRKYNNFSIAGDGADAFWILAKPYGDLWRMDRHGLAQVPGDFKYNMLNPVVGGAVLFSGARGIEQRAPGQRDATPIRAANGQVPAPFDARNGDYDGRNYWASHTLLGQVKLVDGQWRTLAALGFPAGRSVVKTDPQGHVWLMYDDKVIDTQQTPPRVYGKADGIDIGRLAIFHARQDVAVMSATGMAVRVGTRFYPLRTDVPDLLANARAMTASANGDRWINANAGLVRILAADWQAWTAQPHSVVATTLFDASDGYPGAQGVPPSRMETTDDGKRVWFVGKRGLAWIDSTTIARNAIAPRVEVVALHAGPNAFFGNERAHLAAGTRNIGIDYTALGFTMPERLRFRHRLAGLDGAWQDAGTRRTVDYTNLGPGDYTFEVIAANEDGVWSSVPAAMHFSIAPLATQTWWFFALCTFAVMGALALLHRARVRSVRKHMAERLHERLHERERIARSLHDTYLQSVQGLVYVFQGLAQRQPATDGTRQALDRALEMADDVLIQGREQVLGLRTSARGVATIELSLTEIGLALAENTRMACTVDSAGAVRELRGHVLEEVFSIGREALLNAFRHSQGTVVEVALHYHKKKFTMAIQDDGIGLPEAMLALGNRAGHWGLPGMRERADTIHGTLAIANVPGGGTRIVLTVPGRTAYVRNVPAPWQAPARWWRRWRLPGS